MHSQFHRVHQFNEIRIVLSDASVLGEDEVELRADCTGDLCDLSVVVGCVTED